MGSNPTAAAVKSSNPGDYRTFFLTGRIGPPDKTDSPENGAEGLIRAEQQLKLSVKIWHFAKNGEGFLSGSTERMKEMEVKEFSPELAKPVMRFKKIFRSAQGMAIYGSLVFQLYHTGKCAIYDLKTRSESPLAVFPLGSSNDGVPDDNYINHANQCMFSDRFIGGNELPLLYVTIGYGTAADDDGYYYRCAVENITLEKDESEQVIGGHSETIQTISYKDGGIENTGWQQPCWGCPAWFVDVKGGSIYMFSAKYRTTAAYEANWPDNRYIITRFPLPDPEDGGFVTFGPKDILDQFDCPFDIPFTQGGMIAGNKLFYSFGNGCMHDYKYPDGLRVYDLDHKCLCAKMDLKDSCLGAEEVESISFFGDELYINTNAVPAGGYYSLGTGFAELVK